MYKQLYEKKYKECLLITDDLTPSGCTGETIMMAPAAGFYTTPGAGINEVRIAYVLQKKDLQRALVVLRKALELYPGRTLED